MLVLLLAGTLTLLQTPKLAEAESSPQVYLIDIQGVGTWWPMWNSTEIAMAAKTLFEANGFEVEIITNFSRLDFIVNNPPENVIVINTHGEVMPMSTSWSDWTTYFTKLGNNVKDHAWIFVSVLGYPLFYYDQGSGMVCVWGVNTFLSVVPGLSVECKIVMHYDPAYPSNLTDTGCEAAAYMGTSLPPNTITIRPHRWSVDLDYVFYLQIDDPWAAEGFKYGASAVSMGNGFFILNGFGDGRLEPEVPLATNKTVGEAAATFSAYIRRKPISIVAATVNIDPDSLNLKSKGNWITAYIELPEGYDINNINVSTIMLNDTVPAELRPTAIGDYDSDGIPDLMVKFNRTAVQAILRVGDKVEITISGKLIDGRLFEGKDTIKVILPP